MSNDVDKIIGQIKCVEVKEQEDGSALLVFDIDEEFKQNYIKMFNLIEWSVEHFENSLAEAIENTVKLHKEQKGE
jgi:hypothetical protein